MLGGFVCCQLLFFNRANCKVEGGRETGLFASGREEKPFAGFLQLTCVRRTLCA